MHLLPLKFEITVLSLVVVTMFGKIVISIGSCKPNAMWTILQINCATRNSKNKWWMVSLLSQKQHFSLPLQFRLEDYHLLKRPPLLRTKQISWLLGVAWASIVNKLEALQFSKGPFNRVIVHRVAQMPLMWLVHSI